MTDELYDYDWALIRLMPDVVRGDACTVGVVLHARRAGFLGVRLNPGARRLCGDVDSDLVARYLESLTAIADGGPAAGPIGMLPPSERFHWLTSPRSTVLQPSPVHTGRTNDPPGALQALYEALVAPAPAGR